MSSSSAENPTTTTTTMPIPATPGTPTAAPAAPATPANTPVMMVEPKKVQKQRVVIPPPPCPPGVATAYLLLRGALLGILGVAPNDDATIVSLLQPTYIKDKALTAKFGIQLGKKQGNGVVALTDTTAALLLDRISDAVNRMISENLTIHVTPPMTKQDAVSKYGTHILDAGMMKKMKDTDMITVASIPGIIQCIPPAMPYATTSGSSEAAAHAAAHAADTASSRMTRITILPSPDSSITYGARKAEVLMKFKVEENENAEGALCEPCADGFDLDINLLEKKIRLPEGHSIFEQQQQQQDAEEAVAAADAAAEAAKKEQEEHAATATAPASTEMVVNAFEVSGKIDYAKLVDKFGSKIIEAELMTRLTQFTVGQGRVPHLHRFLRRNIFFSHRDLNLLLDCVQQQHQQNKNMSPFYLYTGRGPSSTAMHLGHLVPFLFTQWLQQAFDCPLVIQMTDDEKFLFKGEYSDETGDNLNYFRSLTMENAKDIIACGFNKDKTFIFSDCDYVGRMYPNICRIWKAVTTNTVNGIFGFDGTSNIGKIAFPAIQAAPSFVTSFPVVLKDAPPTTACLIPCAIDQDPYFRMTRDVAHKLVPPMKTTNSSTTNSSSGTTTTTTTSSSSKKQVGHLLGGKPALIHSKFFPPLQGSDGKMSSSDTNSAIFLTDSPEDIAKKITKFAYSGGQETRALQEELGADLDADVSYQWLRFFLEDDEELEAIGASYKSGSGDYWSTGMVKKRLITVLQELVAAHQERRAKITDDEVREWMKERCIL